MRTTNVAFAFAFLWVQVGCGSSDPNSRSERAAASASGEAVALVFEKQPASGTAGVVLHPVRISARDGTGSRIAFPADVTITLASAPPGAVLSGTTTLTPNGMSSNFNTLSVQLPGTYTLRATSGLLEVESAPFYVAAAGAPPTDLTYSVNPAVYTKGVVIAENLPSNSGGIVASYSVSPALPPGLSLDASTGIISGKPTSVVATASYTVTASMGA